MTDPTPGQVTVDTADRPLNSLHRNVAEVLLGADDSGRPAVEVRLGYAVAKSVSWTADVVVDADLLDDLAHALMTAADHLRQEAAHDEA